MELTVYKADGTAGKKKITLSDAIFAIEPNDHLIYEDVRSYLANQRQGTAKVKGRSDVAGSTRKLFKQKGTGGARRGNLRSPLLKGGGTMFGPQPRDYVVSLTKKMRTLARKSALSYKAKDAAIYVVEDLNFEAPKTAQLTSLLKALQLEGKKVLVLTPSYQENVYKSGRNVEKVSVLEANKPSTYEILHADAILFQESAVAVLENTLSPKVAEVE